MDIITKHNMAEWRSAIDDISSSREYIRLMTSAMGVKFKNGDNEKELLNDLFLNMVFDRKLSIKSITNRSENYLEHETFINSSFVSDYIKNSIKKFIPTDSEIDLSKRINEMSSQETKILVEAARKGCNEGEVSFDLCDVLNKFLYFSDGEGQKIYIKNNVNKGIISQFILKNARIVARPSYYAGRGVRKIDLNADHLTSIYISLRKIDPIYASEFVKLVNNMETLGASEFIDTFFNFVLCNFDSTVTPITKTNIVLNDVDRLDRSKVAFTTIVSILENEQTSSTAKFLTEEIKREFLEKVRNINRVIENEKQRQANEYKSNQLGYLTPSKKVNVGDKDLAKVNTRVRIRKNEALVKPRY